MHDTDRPAPPGGPPAAPVSPVSRRFSFIDALRGLAVVVMIETHVVNALLDPALKRGVFHSALTYINGLVAPAFLFCAGLGFAIFLARRNDDVVRAGPAFRGTVGRALFILVLGYSLHVPHFSLRAMMSADAETWRAFFQVDVLQVIGASLLGLLFLSAAVRSERGRDLVAFAATVAALAWWYVVPADAMNGLPDWILAYVSRERSPLFTIVPWGAFLSAGFLAGRRYLSMAAAGKEAVAVRSFAIASVAFAVAGGAAALFTMSLYPAGDWWYWSVEYVLLRMASVIMVMTLLWRVLRTGGGWMSRVLEAFGRESLAVYYLHLILVYGKDFPYSFIRLWPEGSGYAFCALLTVALCAAMAAWAWWWGSAKRSYPGAATWAVRAAVAGSVISFVVS